jgi:SAM-dependent methyltransferase
MAAVVDRFGSRAKEYAAGRPGYPETILDDLPLGDAQVIIELGAGTGKFTRTLARTGRRIIAVEPSKPMADRIPAEVGAAVDVLIAAAESVPLPDAAADLVCVATAIHWFDYGPATAEIHRLLRPGGHLAVIFNRRDERVPWVAALSKMLDSHARGAPRRSRGQWRAILSEPRFRVVKETKHYFAQHTSREGIYDRVFSTSYIIALPPAEQDQVRADVAAIIAGELTLGNAERVDFPYVTELHLLQRVP